MVNITKCEICGRVIPATEHGCAYCDRERGEHAPQPERPYLPLAIRLLLVLLCVDAMAVAVISLGGLWHAWGLRAASDASGALPAAPTDGPGTDALRWLVPTVRALVAVAGATGVFVRRPVGRWLCLAFIVSEALGGLLAATRLLGPIPWPGTPLAPLWTGLFFFLFMRADVIRRFDARAADRRELHVIMRSVQKGGPH